MVRQRLVVDMRDLRQHLAIGRDDQLRVAVTERPAYPVWFPTPHEHHLVRITNHVLPTDVPHKESAVRETDLEVLTEAFGSLLRAHDFAANVFDQSHGEI